MVTERAANIDVARTDKLDVRAHAYHRRTFNEKRAAKKLIGYLLTNSTSPTPLSWAAVPNKRHQQFRFSAYLPPGFRRKSKNLDSIGDV